MGQVSHFLGIRFQWEQTKTSLRVHMSQQAFSENLIHQAGLSDISAKINVAPYRSGYPIDAVHDKKVTPQQKIQLEQELRSYVGSLLWLSQGTRPDLATITNILAKHQNNPSPAHVNAAKFAIKYLKGTKEYGIVFDSNINSTITSFIHFPIKTKQITGISDANWGPQDQSIPKPDKFYSQLELYKTRSISGHLITHHGPLHWCSKRQKITARSSAEAEIYATDQCVKDILYLRNIINDLKLLPELCQNKTKIYNDNMACIHWAKSKTTKGLCHIQIPENGVRENLDKIQILHVEGKINPVDLFTKEDKDPVHFKRLRDTVVQKPFTKLTG